MTSQAPVSLYNFARDHGLSYGYALSLVRTGRIIGARKHHLTKRWWIYPPAKLVLDRLSQGRIW